MNNRLVLLGVGQVAREVIRFASPYGYERIVGSTRNPNRLFELVNLQVEPLILPLPSAEVVAAVVAGANVVVSYPPDKESDLAFARGCSDAAAIVYISSTSVYGEQEGIIDDTTEIVACSSKPVQARLKAEEIWREKGAVILRVPGIYGPESGLHMRLQKGEYKLPGDGNRYGSRLHISDLAEIILRIFSSDIKNETFVVGDMQPATHRDVISWLCQRLQLPFPDSIVLKDAHYTQRGNRQVDPARLLHRLGYKLSYPDYRSGYESCITALSPDN